MGNEDKDKDKEQNSDAGAGAGAMGATAGSAHDVHHASWDLSHERAAALDKLVLEAIARETTKRENERTAVNLLESRLCPPLTGPRTSLSTRDGSCGLIRLDTRLIAWKETQRRLKFHISTIG